MSTLYFYILKDPDCRTKSKIGITKNPEQRLRSYRTACPQCTFSYIKEISHKKIEKDIMFHLKGQFKVDRELVHCNPSMLRNIVEGLMEDFNQMG